MNTSESFEKICRAMASPDFYPHEVPHLERIDTHISAVFLTGKWVYKLKKPVNFEFLNFETLEARRHFCEREVALNRRLTSNVYMDVLEVRQGEDGVMRLSGTGQVVDHLVKMRQLSHKDNLETLLDQGKIDENHMTALGQKLAAFYSRCGVNEDILRFGSSEVISFNMEENFSQVQPFVDTLVEREKWEFIRAVSRAFFKNHEKGFAERVCTHRIRDGHGDLKVEHVYFEDNIQVIDCIEFNDRFRYGDVASDIAFLYMDLDRLGHMPLGCAFLKAVARHSGDHGLYGFTDFYAAYRAVVKLKVACLGAGGDSGGEKALAARKATVQKSLDQAYRYAVAFGRPTLWVFCGPPACGKSTLAQKLSDTLLVPLIQSDRVRKAKAGLEVHEKRVVPLGTGLYRPALRRHTYAHMLLEAQDWLEKGRSVILDGTYSHRKWRDDARCLAEDLDTNLIFVECTASREHIAARLRQREETSSLSDARLEHLDGIMAQFDPLVELDPAVHIRVSTETPPEDSFAEVMGESHDRKWAQIRKLSAVASVL